MKYREWHDFVPDIKYPENSTHIDLGSGSSPRNPLGIPKSLSTDLHHMLNEGSSMLDLTKPLPLETNSIFSFSAFDVLEHIPRWDRNSNGAIVFPFVGLMSEIYRCLTPGGYFIASTPAFPSPAAFQDPTHINFITIETLKSYFSGEVPLADTLGYGFSGKFDIIKNEWLLGTAVYTGLKEHEMKFQSFNIRASISRLMHSRAILRKLWGFLRHQKIIDSQPTHILWVVRKPSDE